MCVIHYYLDDFCTYFYTEERRCMGKPFHVAFHEFPYKEERIILSVVVLRAR